MKKNLFSILMLSMLLLGLGWVNVSCSESNTDNQENVDDGGEKPGENPEDPEKPGKPDEPITGQPEVGSNPTLQYNVPTPIDCKAGLAEGNAAGVKIEVKSVLDNNFVFEITPGSAVQSYKLDVFPLAHLYNSLYEAGFKNSGKTSLTTEESAALIEQMLFNQTGSGGYLFSPDQHEDFAKKTFSWNDTEYCMVPVLPGAEYVIVAAACYDKDGYEPTGEMQVCYVVTTESPMVGTPEVELDILTTFNGWKVSYKANKDCKYVSFFVSNRSELDPYEALYGEALCIDYMRHSMIGGPTNVADFIAVYGEDPYTQLGGLANIDPNFEFEAWAVAMDENMRAVDVMVKEVFTIKEKPTGNEPAGAKLTVHPEYVGARSFMYTWEFDKHAYAGVFRYLTLAEYESEWKNMTAEELAAKAEFVYNDQANFEGQNNHNFSMDPETYEVDGEGQISSSCSAKADLVPGETYVLAYTARNGFYEYLPVQFTDPFTLDALTTDSPTACKSDCVMDFHAEGRTSLAFNFEYTVETTAVIHFQVLAPYCYEAGFDRPTPDADRSTMLGYLLNLGGDANHFAAGYKDDVAQTTLSGFDEATEYTVAWCVEDWDGVVGEVHLATARTAGSTTTGNPEVTLTAAFDEDGKPYVDFKMNTDVQEMLTVILGYSAPDDLHLMDLYQGRFTADYYEDLWFDYVSTYGIKRSSDHSTLDETSDPFTQMLMVAAAVGWGYDPDGNVVYTDLQYVVYDNSTGTPVFKKIEDYLK